MASIYNWQAKLTSCYDSKIILGHRWLILDTWHIIGLIRVILHLIIRILGMTGILLSLIWSNLVEILLVIWVHCVLPTIGWVLWIFWGTWVLIKGRRTAPRRTKVRRAMIGQLSTGCTFLSNSLSPTLFSRYVQELRLDLKNLFLSLTHRPSAISLFFRLFEIFKNSWKFIIHVVGIDSLASFWNEEFKKFCKSTLQLTIRLIIKIWLRRKLFLKKFAKNYEKNGWKKPSN